MANARKIANIACSAMVRKLIFTDMASGWAKAMATDNAARNGMNMGILRGLLGTKKSAQGMLRGRLDGVNGGCELIGGVMHLLTLTRLPVL